jgi:hypothetical protein
MHRGVRDHLSREHLILQCSRPETLACSQDAVARAEAHDTTAPDDTQPSAPVLLLHPLSGRASVSAPNWSLFT